MPKRYPETPKTVVFKLDAETKATLNQMVLDYGMPDRLALLKYLCQAYSNGLLMVVDKATKECLVGAADERMLKMAKRAARDETRWVLYSEGYRATPYDT
jgi:hypothetical protein